MNRRKTDYYDYNLVAVILLLVSFGLVMLYSTSSYVAEVKYGDDMYLFVHQAVISAAAVALALGLSLLDYHILWYLSIPLYAGAMILMGLVMSPLGVTRNGARRWLRLFIEFQPSEVAKIAAIVCVPVIIIMMGKQFKGWKGCVPPLVAGLLLGLGAYAFTDNLSTGIIIIAIACVIVFVAHPETRPFLIIAAVGAVLLVLLVWFLWNYADADGSFRIRRVLVWRDPEAYPDSGGYQIMQALYAIGSGGLFGKGLGNSTQKLGSLPEAQNDMIFSIICEELGIFGGLIVIILFIFLLYRLFFIAQNAPDLFGSLMVTGIFAHISLQVILNICVVLNLIPTTGVTLPFISYGGTSVAFLMVEMAIALSVSRRIRFKRNQQDLWGEVNDFA